MRESTTCVPTDLSSNPSFTPAYVRLLRSGTLAARAEAALEHLADCDLCVYNSGGHDSPEVLRLLDGIVDTDMPDMKYADSEAARR